MPKSDRTAASMTFSEDAVDAATAHVMEQVVLTSFRQWEAPILITALVKHAAMGARTMPSAGWTRADFVELAGRAYDYAIDIDRLISRSMS